MTHEDLFSVRGRTALVTGAASGIGLAIVEALAEGGARVAMLDRDVGRLEAERDRLVQKGLDVSAEACDVAGEEAVVAAFGAAVATLGSLDIVFANAGIGAEGGGYLDRDGNRRDGAGLEDYSLTRWNQTLGVNLTGAFLTVREATRYMKPRRQGRIILTSSVTASNNPAVVGAPYPVSKAAVAHFMRGAALELATYGILVNAIAPGLFATRVAGGALLDEAVQARAGAGVPLGRVGQPEEIKGLALFLASQASNYVTGAHIAIDGGLAVGRADRA
jgi:NAD(P)-dependent dehydrogenase (short-subunit alcohol dehydrogenase family)